MKMTDAFAGTCAQVLPILVFAALVQYGRYRRSLVAWFATAPSKFAAELPGWIDPELAVSELEQLNDSRASSWLILRSRTFWGFTRSVVRFLSRPIGMLTIGSFIFVLAMVDISAEIFCLLALAGGHLANPERTAGLVFGAVIASLVYLILFPIFADVFRLAKASVLLEDEEFVNRMRQAQSEVREILLNALQKQRSPADDRADDPQDG
jgi:hypothetical protein